MSSKYRRRERDGRSARELADNLPPALERRREDGLAASTAPLIGVTTDGTAIPGLFTLADTGLGLADVAAAANAFRGALTPAQATATAFALDAPEWRQWSNVHPFLMRHGLLLETLDDAGRERALDVVRAALSPAGFATARNIMRLNETIREITGSDAEYGEWLYWLSIFGDPSGDSPWGWQLDGHHLIVNCMLIGGQLVATPTFMGTEPVTADVGKYNGTTVFHDEESQAYALMASLTDVQRAKALIGDQLPGEVFTTAFRDNFETRYEGIRYDDLATNEQAALVDLIETYVGRTRADQAALKMDEVKAHLRDTYFAWMGGVADDAPFYYRVHSPVVLIEFDHQRGVALDNDEASRAHTHTIIRTPNGNDYGADLLRQHHEHGHAH
jgi:hypothetical protein